MSEGRIKFSSVIIGTGTLPIRCAEMLLGAGHQICAVVSTDPEIRKWAGEHELHSLVPGGNLVSRIEEPFDYLFSIVNEHILDESALSLPRKLAINYHDGPLPRYAGTHATSWALMNGETVHGISWHVITDLVDGGDILRQKFVEISEVDTAFTLNTKCYEAAVEAFTELVQDISSGTLRREKQDLAKRTFFPKFKRPANGGVISWNSSAAEISALVRALNFGPHPNPLGVAKIAVGDEFVIVGEVYVGDGRSISAPGIINEIAPDGIRVSTSDRDLILRKLFSLEGKPLSISDLARAHNLQVGSRLDDLSYDAARQFQNAIEAACRDESYWIRKFSSLEPAAPPFASRTGTTVSASYADFPLLISEKTLSFLSGSLHTRDFKDSFLAAFGIFVARLNDAESFDLGFRDTAPTAEVLGHKSVFAAQVPLRFNVDRLQNFQEISRGIAEELTAVRGRKPYLHDLVVRYPQLRSASEGRNRFAFPIAVVMSDTLKDWQPAVQNELVLVISENGSECRFVYDRSRFDIGDMEKLSGHLTTFLESLAADPTSPAAYLPLLTEEQRHQVLVDWNATAIDYPKDKCVHELFIERAENSPDAAAVICESEQISYAELNRRSNQLAHHLRRMGIKTESLVAVCMERSIETVVGLLGILKAGGAYVPLDPTYPKDRIAFMLKDAGIEVLLTQERKVPSLPDNACNVLCLDTEWGEIAKESTENLESVSTAGSLAYVIYTSGSTGRPKGVEIEHGGLSNLVNWHGRVYELDSKDRATLLAGPAFDASVWELWPYLAVGASIHIPNEETRSSPPRLLTWLAEQRITVSFMPTPMAEAVLELPVPRDLALRALLTGGDRLHQIANDSLPFKVINHYGPTENTVVATCDTIRESEAVPPIGRPIQNVQIYLLDRYLQLVPVGIPGEVFIGGGALARGYRKRPDLTRERFITHSFGDGLPLRLYRTGDLAHYLPDGRINFLDRIDAQVKIRGFRIELGEIETVLLTHPLVKDVIVIAGTNQTGEKSLTAYFVTNKEPVKQADLRKYLEQALPDYMIPAAFVELDEMPLTPNGKIDRKALPVPPPRMAGAERDFVAHRDDLEEKLVKIWESILGIQPIGVHDDFFELGGHSLKAIRMFAEIEEIFGKNIPLATLFESGTVEKLAAILRHDGWAAPESSLVPIQANGTKPPFFCIHAKGGNVLFYQPLAKYLGNDQPFYGLQARRLAGRQIGHETVEEMAEFYIKEMRALQPLGPYYVGGSSFGGVAAFEIAQQLQRQGERVALLALLDTGTPDYPRMLPSTTALRLKAFRFIRRAQHHIESLKTFTARGKADYILEKLKKFKLKYRRKIRDTYKSAVRKFYAATKGANSIPKSYIQIEDLIWKAGQKYKPTVYPGTMTLFRASFQPLGIYPDPTLGWEPFVSGKLEIHEVPGHHGSIVAEPYVRTLADKLRACLEAAQVNEEAPVTEIEQAESGYREVFHEAAVGAASLGL